MSDRFLGFVGDEKQELFYVVLTTNVTPLWCMEHCSWNRCDVQSDAHQYHQPLHPTPVRVICYNTLYPVLFSGRWGQQRLY